MKKMKALYDGKCDACGFPIHKGDQIIFGKNKEVIHHNCIDREVPVVMVPGDEVKPEPKSEEGITVFSFPDMPRVTIDGPNLKDPFYITCKKYKYHHLVKLHLAGELPIPKWHIMPDFCLLRPYTCRGGCTLTGQCNYFRENKIKDMKYDDMKNFGPDKWYRDPYTGEIRKP